MTAKKKNSSKFLKYIGVGVKIHNNRWLIWAIAYVLFIAIALVGYIKITDESVIGDQPEQVFVSWHTYQNPTLGFSFRYPASWAVEAADAVSVTIAPQNGSGVDVSIYKPTAQNFIRKPLQIVSEKPVTVDGVTGTLITNDLGNNAFESVMLVKNQGHIYVIRGSPSDVSKILLTFNFIPITK